MPKKKKQDIERQKEYNNSGNGDEKKNKHEQSRNTRM